MPPVPVFVALADATRCRIITILRDGPQPVHALVACFEISRPAISRHLRVLKAAGLISEDKRGRENLYRLHAKALAPAHDWLAALLPKTKPTSRGASKPAGKAAPRKASASAPLTPSLAKPAAGSGKAPAVSQMGFDF